MTSLIAPRPMSVQPQASAPLSPDVYAALINLAGKRRFLAQRLVLQAVLASLGHDGALAEAQACLSQCEDAHARLMGRMGSLPGVFCDALQQAYFGEADGDAQVRAFLALGTACLAALQGNRIDAPELLAQLVQRSTPVLSLLSTLILIYEEQAKRAAQQARAAVATAMQELKDTARRARSAAMRAQLVAARAGVLSPDIGAATNAVTAIAGELDTLADNVLSRNH